LGLVLFLRNVNGRVEADRIRQGARYERSSSGRYELRVCSCRTCTYGNNCTEAD
jgi:hypothetical protein